MKPEEFFKYCCTISEFKECVNNVINNKPSEDDISVLRSFIEHVN